MRACRAPGHDCACRRYSRAAAAAQPDLVAGSQAEALVALRGSGTALALLPDAREVLALDQAELSPDLQLRYGRPPDARLPGTAG